jgi:alkylhydroperoxidase/carboxymuconolactone decarboxylase family protein YurZ
MAVSEAPRAHKDFVRRFPELGQAWETIGHAGSSGPLDEKMARLIKLAVAVGAMREGAVHTSVRKALDLGITPEELEHVVPLAAGTLGLPSAVAVYTWIREEIAKRQE